MSPSISNGQSFGLATIALPQLSMMPAISGDPGRYAGLPTKRSAASTPDFDNMNSGRPSNSALLADGATARRGSATSLYGSSNSAPPAAGVVHNQSFSFPISAPGIPKPPSNSLDFDELNEEDVADGQGGDGDSPGQVLGKRKIKRIRPLRSCLTCNKRKIKCDRQAPCGPCDKRGEGEKCSLGMPPMTGPAATAALYERLAHLEARVDDLEALQGCSASIAPEIVTSMDAQTAEDIAPPARITVSAIVPLSITSSQDNIPSNTSRSTPIPLGRLSGGQQSITNDATEEAALALESLCRPNLKESRSAHTTYPISGSAVHVNGNRTGSSTIRIDPTIETSAPLARRSLDIRMRLLTSHDFPDRGLADHLTATYFQHLDPYWHVHINPFFEAEYADFWYLRAEDRLAEVDPAWVSLFFVTLALGMQITELPIPQHIQRPDWRTPDDMLAMSDVWVDMAEEMLKAADWIRKPQFRTLQTICLINGYQSMCTLVDPSGAAFNGAAIRIAQLMSFHNLNAGSERMPPDDPAVPPGNNPVKFQLASRLWYSLVVLEHVYAARMGLTLPSASTPYTTTFPLNLDDHDLASSAPLIEKPTWQRTSTSSLHLRWILAKTYNQLLALPVEMPPAEKYQSVLEIDAELRKWLNELPSEPLPKQAGDYAAYKSALWRQWSSLADVHGQLLHLHRPYMVRGYTDPRFSLSTKVCLESAKVICESRQHLQDSIVDERFWWTTMRWLSACIIIFIDLYQAIDAGLPSEALQRKKAEIPHIYAVFQARQKSLYPTTRAFASAAIRVVDNLLDAERVKRTAATRRSSRAGIEQDAEPVGHVFQRIAKTMRSSTGTSAPALSLPEPAISPHFLGHGSGRGEGPSHRDYNSISGVSDTIEATMTQGRVAADALECTPPHSSGVVTPLGQNRSNSIPSTATHSPAHLHQPAFRTLPPAPSGAGLPTLPSISANVMLPVMPAVTPMIGPASLTSSSNTSSNTHSHAYSSNSSSSGSLPTITPSQSLLKEQSNPSPISWDTSHFFHPDPAVLLRDMGYSGPGAAMMPSSHMYPDDSAW